MIEDRKLSRVVTQIHPCGRVGRIIETVDVQLRWPGGGEEPAIKRQNIEGAQEAGIRVEIGEWVLLSGDEQEEPPVMGGPPEGNWDGGPYG